MDRKTWDRFAPFYTLSRRIDKDAYEMMYSLIRKKAENQLVLELATGTGLIAKNIASSAKKVIATDYSEKMIKQAKKGTIPENVRFSVQDACHIKFGDNTFDVVIISNALHIMPEPELALKEIRRVLKPNGLLIAPTYTHGKMSAKRKALSKMMRVIGLKAEHKWNSREYIAFIENNGWKVTFSKTADASFPLTYIECTPNGESI